MEHQIYTFGYSNAAASKQAEELLTSSERVILVDLRFSPASRWKPAWNRARLEQQWGTRQYLFLGHSLGNIHYQDHSKPIELANRDRGVRLIKGLFEAGYTPVLFCACKDYDQCHRKVVVELLKEYIPGLVHQELGADR